ncbi:MAG TPA: hypothetical protein VNC11_08510 [Gemmatimonadaceae bacterium]|nr:hypothetical protein [Gemmatimonadaceae bacterium]
MPRLRAGVVRYASVGRALGRHLGLERAPDTRIGKGRVRVTFNNVGASRWTEAQRLQYAFQVADVARMILADDHRRLVRRRARRAIVVVYDDIALEEGCEVSSKWECVVTADERYR